MQGLLQPTFFEFNETHGITEVLKEKLNMVILYTENPDAPYMETMLEAAKANRGKMLFAYSDMSHKQAANLASALDVSKEDMPILVGIAPTHR